MKKENIEINKELNKNNIIENKNSQNEIIESQDNLSEQNDLILSTAKEILKKYEYAFKELSK